MKKNFLKIALVSAFAMAAGYNIYTFTQKTELSDIMVDNIEALAQGEVIVGRPCAYVPNSMCIYFYPEYFEIPGAFHN